MQRSISRAARVLLAILAPVITVAATAGEIRVACYSDGNECEVTQDLAKRFEAQNPDVKVVIDKVPYKAILEQLPVQLAAGEGPDIARVTDLGGLVEVLPRHHAVREGPEVLGSEFRPDAEVAAPDADRQGHLRA